MVADASMHVSRLPTKLGFVGQPRAFRQQRPGLQRVGQSDRGQTRCWEHTQSEDTHSGAHWLFRIGLGRGAPTRDGDRRQKNPGVSYQL